jgi:hypothetical protein
MMPRWKTALAADTFGEPNPLSMRALTSLPTFWQSVSVDAGSVAVADVAGTAGVLAGAVAGAAIAAPHNVTLRITLDTMLFVPRISSSYSQALFIEDFRTPVAPRIDLYQA